MAEFVVHSIPGSPFGRAVLATLIEKGADFRFEAVRPGTLKSPEHLALHPFGRIPILRHGDFSLYETQAILRYLDRVLPGPALTPADPKAAARMDQMLNVSDWYLFQGAGSVIGFQRVVGPRLLGMTPDEAAIAEAMPRAQAVFAELSRSLGDQAFFAGDSVTLADLMLAPQIDFFVETPEWTALTEGRENLVAWLQRIGARPSLTATTWEGVVAMAA